MSTRATYQFASPSVNVTFYIHSDGYPEGAAGYFYDALFSDAKGGFAEKFFRANPQAEFTAGHDHHFDTVFRYTVVLGEFGEPKTIRAERRGFRSEQWDTFHSGSLNDFINMHPLAGHPREKVIAVQNTTQGGLITIKSHLTTEKRERAAIRKLRKVYAQGIQDAKLVEHQKNHLIARQRALIAALADEAYKGPLAVKS